MQSNRHFLDTTLKQKSLFLTFALITSYAYLHYEIMVVILRANLDKLIHFNAAYPFGQRILTSIIARGIYELSDLPIGLIFYFQEVGFTALFFFTLQKLLSVPFSKREATLLSWLFLLLLPLITVINYKFFIGMPAAIYFPYDTATLFFMTAGYLFCLRAQWIWFYVVVFFATMNRETSLLLLLLLPALYTTKLKIIVRPVMIATIIYILTRASILFLLPQKGSIMEFQLHSIDAPLVTFNIAWLFSQGHLLLFLYCFAGLPVLWFVFYNYIPKRFIPIKYVALFYFLILMLVGRIDEARIFSEIVILLYLPVCIAIKKWLLDEPVVLPQQSRLSYILERYTVFIVLYLFIVCFTVVKLQQYLPKQ